MTALLAAALLAAALLAAALLAAAVTDDVLPSGPVQCSKVTLSAAQMQFLREEAGGSGNICSGDVAPSQCTDAARPPSAPTPYGYVDEGQEGNAIGIIVGGVVGGIVVLVGIYFGCKMMSAKAKPSTNGGGGGVPMQQPVARLDQIKFLLQCHARIKIV